MNNLDSAERTNGDADSASSVSSSAIAMTSRDPQSKGLISRILARLFQVFSPDSDGSLRESLEGVFEQHQPENHEIGPEERTMLLNILKFGALRVDDVMVPRADIVAVGDDVVLSDLLKVFKDAGHSRVPVYRETLDDPTGMVHIKDLLPWLTGQPCKPAAGCQVANGAKGAASGGRSRKQPDLKVQLSKLPIIRDVLFVPPTMPVVDLLVKMQSTHIHLALVIDEYGGTDGLVSIEDLVEEIVGEIEDEHDTQDRPMIEPEETGGFIADARVPIEDLEALLKVDLLPDELDEDIDTLGGLVFTLLGRVPVRGELIRHTCGIEFEVLEADPRRIKRLRIDTPQL